MHTATPESGDDIYASDENFAALFAESIEEADTSVGTVVTGTVIAIENDMALIDVGLKADGRVSLKEFSGEGEEVEIKLPFDSPAAARERLDRLGARLVQPRFLEDNQVYDRESIGCHLPGASLQRQSGRGLQKLDVGRKAHADSGLVGN